MRRSAQRRRNSTRGMLISSVPRLSDGQVCSITCAPRAIARRVPQASRRLPHSAAPNTTCARPPANTADRIAPCKSTATSYRHASFRLSQSAAGSDVTMTSATRQADRMNPIHQGRCADRGREASFRAHKEFGPPPTNHPISPREKLRARRTRLAVCGSRPHRAQPHHEQPVDLLPAIRHDQDFLGESRERMISLVEWSFASPTISTRPPFSITTSRSGTDSAV